MTLNGGNCSCHWGYMLEGRMIVRYGDHPPEAEAGSEFIQFSPKDQLAETMAAIQANAQQVMQGG